MIFAGIDAGSRSIKVVLFDAARGCVARTGIVDQGVGQERLAEELLDRVLAEAGLARKRLAGVVATGYGRNALRFADAAVTEITCHARGVRQLAPDAGTIVEIGGQDSKIIILDGEGLVRDFVMNDRCAAGSGRFLEVVAARLGVGLKALGDLSAESRSPAQISSMCVVFAETEIIGLLADGTSPRDIAAGVQNAIAARAIAMAGHTVRNPVYFTGGVALQTGMIRAVEQALARKVAVVPSPQFTGALGAALVARQARR